MNKKPFVLTLLFFLVAAIYAREVKLAVTDAELEIPLEGVKLYSKQQAEAIFTDENGEAIIIISDDLKSEVFKAHLPGYKDEEFKITANDNAITLQMSIEDIFEGQEIVVNRAAPETQEEKVGVSTVITNEQMHTTANMGLVEDCMASVRTLPGVSYSGAWGNEPSVRGGEPRELGVTLDGMYTIFPWHWGGVVSILNPSMVDSIKLSNGVFSARYGKASSGLLEATTLKPDYENFHLNASISSISSDVFAQIPFGKKVGGMLVGAHLTYLDPVFALYKATGDHTLDMIKRPPYIRDFFLKANFNPKPELDISLIGFFGSDGMEIDQTKEIKDFYSRSIIDYNIYEALGGLNIKYLLTDKIQLRGLIGYNGMFEDRNQKQNEKGKVYYTDEFVSQYSMMNGVQQGGFYTLPELDSSFFEKINSHLINAKFESDFELSDKNHICAGAEEILILGNAKNDQSVWTDISFGNQNYFSKFECETTNDANFISNAAGFVTWNYGTDTSLISSELGLRTEFISFFDTKDFNKMLVPQICPRASVTVTPWRNIGSIKKASITTGTGIFASTPREVLLLNESFKSENDKLSPNSALFAVLGGNIELENDWNFKLETYYKYYLSKMYMYTVSTPTGSDTSIYMNSDGKGHIFGVDTMIEKSKGKIWDGYLSYSFVYARFLNPAGTYENKIVSPTNNCILNEWYYPNYHRFHTVNLVSNWHFGNGWTFTVKGTLATGTPKAKNGDLTCYASTMDDGTVIQRYTRSSVYSDTLRTQISCPVDLRIAREWTSNNGKTKYEFYFGLQDVFVNLYSPKGDKSYNSHTGEMSSVADSVDFSIGLPIPSIGFKIQF